MPDFKIHSPEEAPDHAKETLARAKAKYGFVPNLIGAMSASPQAADAYMAIGDALRQTAFTTEELHVVWFTINTIHECTYCMAAHSGIAKADKIAADVVETARAGGDYADPKLQALKVFTTKMVLQRGWVDPSDMDAFLAAGYTERTVLDLILAISHKVLSNYTNHVVSTPVDAPFQSFAWTPAKAAE